MIEGQWITGQELINHWHLQDFELFEFLKKGLPVYTRHGKKIVDEVTLERRRIVNSIEEAKTKIIQDQKAKENVGPLLRPGGFTSGPRYIDIEARAKKLYNTTYLVTPTDAVVRKFDLPLDAKKAQEMINEAKGYLFKKQEAEAFGQGRGLSSLLIPNTQTSIEPYVAVEQVKERQINHKTHHATSEAPLRGKKKIADFLGISIDKLDQLRKEGLPVYDPPEGRRGVYGYPTELNEWMDKRGKPRKETYNHSKLTPLTKRDK